MILGEGVVGGIIKRKKERKKRGTNHLEALSSFISHPRCLSPSLSRHLGGGGRPYEAHKTSKLANLGSNVNGRSWIPPPKVEISIRRKAQEKRRGESVTRTSTEIVNRPGLKDWTNRCDNFRRRNETKPSIPKIKSIASDHEGTRGKSSLL
jgi:hypothetical protein